jgi:phage I-like protein
MSGPSATSFFYVALNAEQGVPSEIMLLPAGGTITTVDGRGPYKVVDAARIAAESLQAAGGKILIDENHATDWAMPRGEPAPARGWIVALNARTDGLWGRVEWTEAGKQLVGDRAYRGISPALAVANDGTIQRVLRASLINVPNLRGMAALHAQLGADGMLKSILQALGLKEDADEKTALAAVQSLKSTTALQSALAPIAKAAGLKDGADATAICTAVTALQSSLAPIAKAAGLKDDASATEICTAVTTLAAGAKDGKTIVALQAELTDVTTKLNTLTKDRATDRATAFVDGEIVKGRVGVKPLRDHYIATHAADPARVEKEIGAMPILTGPSIAQIAPPDGSVELNSEQLAAAATAHQKKLADAGQTIDFATAVLAVQQQQKK